MKFWVDIASLLRSRFSFRKPKAEYNVKSTDMDINKEYIDFLKMEKYIEKMFIDYIQFKTEIHLAGIKLKLRLCVHFAKCPSIKGVLYNSMTKV